ncbi:MAG: chemotaxis protein CheB [Actinomycetota bacterium]|nr:chemotaxis protein CheB [Actinomycetota bacterium]
MAKRDVLVIGASAGGIEALRELVAGLPKDFSAAVLVVLHLPPRTRSALPHILERAGSLQAKQAEDGDELLPGRLLVAAPDQHLIVRDNNVTLSRGPVENGHRPAVDVLFRSAALVHGPKVIGVVLSGALDDGTAGLAAIRSRGGIGVVQDPQEALHPSMPRCAIEGAAPEHIVRVADMPALLVRLVEEEVDSTALPRPSALLEAETAMARLADVAYDTPDRPGRPSGYSCPDCSGGLFVIEEGDLLRFRCRVGHAWTAESLVSQQSAALEGALWVALRSLEEKASLTRDMSRRAANRGHRHTAEMFDAQYREALTSAKLVRDLMVTLTSESIDLEQQTDTGQA